MTILVQDWYKLLKRSRQSRFVDSGFPATALCFREGLTGRSTALIGRRPGPDPAGEVDWWELVALSGVFLQTPPVTVVIHVTVKQQTPRESVRCVSQLTKLPTPCWWNTEGW